MTCAYCGAGHRADRHGGLARKARWWAEPYPFRERGAPRPVQVVLTEEQVRAVEERARRIVRDDERRGWRMHFTPGFGESALDVGLRGYGAELAAALATGLELRWAYLGDDYRSRDKPPDLGRRTEVRNARSATGRLVAHEGEPAGRVFLLVTGWLPTFALRGWLEGADLVVPERRLEPPEVRHPGYFAEVDELELLPLPEDA